jgi:phosphogluconate dehydratase
MIKPKVHSVLEQVRERIAQRSAATRAAYLARLEDKSKAPPSFKRMSCSNLAHGTAVLDQETKNAVISGQWDNIGIVSAYNEMLSAHQPYVNYPEKIANVLHPLGLTTQFAGGVPAMCDGITQGMPGMELSLFSRDSIARATAIALSHDVFQGAVLLGICDKIIPGLVIGALSFGHLPIMPLPAGPMPTGLSNEVKGKSRQQYAKGDIEKTDLLAAEMKCYHGAGTCTFFGTANTNQMLMEFLGLHLPGASFVNPGTPLREALNVVALKAFVERLSSPVHQLGTGGVVGDGWFH